MCVCVCVCVCVSTCVHALVFVSPASESVGLGVGVGRKQTLSPSNCGVWEERSLRKRLSQHRSLGPSLTPPWAALRVWGEKVQALWDSLPEKDPRPMGKLGPTRGAEDRRGRASHACPLGGLRGAESGQTDSL